MRTYRVKAFTIFEVTVVLAVMSTLITMISSALNRFNEQLKLTSDVRQELNHWYAVRSVIWHDFYQADSLLMAGGQLSMFSEQGSVSYRLENGMLERMHGADWLSLEIPAEQLYADSSGDAVRYHMVFIWKDKPMDLCYHHQPGIDLSVNHYFDQLP